MGNDDGLSGVSFCVSFDTAGNVIREPLDMPHIDVDVRGQESVAQARALAAAILEAADFWEKSGY